MTRVMRAETCFIYFTGYVPWAADFYSPHSRTDPLLVFQLSSCVRHHSHFSPAACSWRWRDWVGWGDNDRETGRERYIEVCSELAIH